MKKKLIFLFIVMVTILLSIFISYINLKEKYCYNLAFSELDSRNIKLGDIPSDFTEKGFSPIEVFGTPGQKEWREFYLKCRDNFHLSDVNFAILRKTYPDYRHFIDW